MSAVNELMLDYVQVYKVLIVAPLRVARDTWPNELKKWDHLKNLRMSVVMGDQKQRVKALQEPAHLYTINRENLKWLVDYYDSNKMDWDFDMVVIDELSSFKNHKSQRWKALRSIRAMCRRIIGLTGTPAPNSLFDLWAEIGILDQGERLGRFITRYRESYFRPKSYNPSTGVVFQYELRDGAEQRIYDRISDICISMKALDYLDMPECSYTEIVVRMSEQEKILYDQLKTDLILPMAEGDVEAANAAALSNKLLQMANGAVYDENGTVREFHKKKLEALEDLIEAANGQNVLIAYWFKHDKDRIVDYFAKRKAHVRSLQTSKDMDDWNDGKIPIALIHPASAGHGLNIQQGGHILIWFGLTWSLEAYQQTNARLWRQGQRERVSIHHIITENSVDENVMKALNSKEFRQEDLIAAVKAQLYGK